MRLVFSFLLGLLLAACAADMPVEDDIPATIYTNPEERAASDSIARADAPEAAPTPYGMTIAPDTEGADGEDPTNETPAARITQRMLTGRWVNASDGEEMVEFTPTHYKTYYQGELLVEEDMTFHGACPGACSGGTSTGEPCFTISGPAQTDCYGIVALTDDRLELQLLGISAETVVYRRAD